MIKAVIFDCFGVLTTEGWLAFKHEYFGHNPKLFEEATINRKHLDLGLINHKDLIKTTAKLAGVSPRKVRAQIDYNDANKELLSYIKLELEPHYKLGMLSNAGSNELPKIFSEDQINMFDVIALSFETGLVKPDLKAYHSITEKLGVIPQQCIFVDDQKRHCEAARQVGMRAILYQNFEQMKTELEQILAS